VGNNNNLPRAEMALKMLQGVLCRSNSKNSKAVDFIVRTKPRQSSSFSARLLDFDSSIFRFKRLNFSATIINKNTT